MADVKVRIIAVDEASEPMKKAGQEVENVGKKAKEAGGAFEGMGKTMSAIAGGLGLQMGLSAIVGALKNAIVGSFELADALEQSKIAFTTMLGSGEKAGQMLNDLKSFADKTPFEFQDIQAAAKRLMAMGTAAEDVIPTLTAVGDAAAGLGGGKATIDSITLALGQMGAKGKISTQELNQLTEKGIPALRYLADAAGVTTGEMAKLVEKGLVPADSGVQVLLASMKQDFGGMMALQAETASGKLSTMKDAMAGLATETGKTFVPAVKAGADVITEMANAAEEYVARVNRQADAQHDLVDAFKNGYVDVVQFGQAVEITTNKTTSGYEETTYRVIDFAKAYDLLKVAGVNQAYAMEQSETRFTALYDATHKSTIELNLNREAIDNNKEALRLQADSFSTLSGASKEYDTDTEKLAETTAKHQKIVDDLTAAHGKNQAAILAGTGTIKDNSDAIDKSALLHRDLKQDVQELNEKQAEGKISGDDYTLAMDHLNIKIREQDEAHKLLVATQGTGLTAVQLAAVETGTYTTKLGEATAALEADKAADLLLQTQVATRIKEGIVLDQLASDAKDGLSALEITRIEAEAAALGIANSTAIKDTILVQTAATLLADARKTYAGAFASENEAGMASFASFVNSISGDVSNHIQPDLKKAQDAAKLTAKEFREIATEYNSVQSREVTLRITTIREELKQSVIDVKGFGAPAMGTVSVAGKKAGGGAVMGSAGAYLVGERGPELFNPAGTGGSITPNGALGRGGLAIGTLNVYGVQSTSELFNQLSKEARARGMQFAVN